MYVCIGWVVTEYLMGLKYLMRLKLECRKVCGI